MPWRTGYKENSPPHYLPSSHVEAAAQKKAENHSNERTHARNPSQAHTHTHSPSKRYVCLSHSLSLSHCVIARTIDGILRSQKTIIIIHPMHSNSCLASAPSSHNQQPIMYDWWKKWRGRAQLLRKRKNERASCDTSEHEHSLRSGNMCACGALRIVERGFYLPFVVYDYYMPHSCKMKRCSNWSVKLTRAFDTRTQMYWIRFGYRSIVWHWKTLQIHTEHRTIRKV